MSEEIQRYVYDALFGKYVRPMLEGERREIMVRWTDHQRVVAEKVREAMTQERDRCRREEVQPLIDAWKEYRDVKGDGRHESGCFCRMVAAVREVQQKSVQRERWTVPPLMDGDGIAGEMAEPEVRP